MSKPPSDVTQLRALKTAMKHTKDQLDSTLRERDVYRARATKAEQEVAEWKQRFDLLLKKEPKK